MFHQTFYTPCSLSTAEQINVTISLMTAFVQIKNINFHVVSIKMYLYEQLDSIRTII